jgi:hypothetical protein
VNNFAQLNDEKTWNKIIFSNPDPPKVRFTAKDIAVVQWKESIKTKIWKLQSQLEWCLTYSFGFLTIIDLEDKDRVNTCIGTTTRNIVEIKEILEPILHLVSIRGSKMAYC